METQWDMTHLFGAHHQLVHGKIWLRAKASVVAQCDSLRLTNISPSFCIFLILKFTITLLMNQLLDWVNPLFVPCLVFFSHAFMLLWENDYFVSNVWQKNLRLRNISTQLRQVLHVTYSSELQVLHHFRNVMINTRGTEHHHHHHPTFCYPKYPLWTSWIFYLRFVWLL